MSDSENHPKDFFEAGGRGLQHTGMRKTNQRAVLTLISLQPGLFNAEISRRSGLAPQTISAILADLEGELLIRRGTVLRGRRGQPATPMYINGPGAFALGVNVGWRHLEIVLLNIAAEVVGHYRRDYAFPDAHSIVSEIVAAGADLLAQLEPAERRRVIGIGLATPNRMAEVMPRIGAPAEQAELWANLDLRGQIESALQLETLFTNDGNAACWGELVGMPAPRPTSFAYVHLGTFLGAGIVAQGMLWEGPTGSSANLGSMLVTHDSGETAYAHNIASLKALEAALAAAGLEVPTGNPMAWDWDSWEPVFGQWLDRAAQAIAKVLINTAAVIEVEAAVIDGTMPPALIERLVRLTTKHLQTLTDDGGPSMQLLAGRLGPLASAMGAAEILIYRKYFSRSLDDIAG